MTLSNHCCCIVQNSPKQDLGAPAQAFFNLVCRCRIQALSQIFFSVGKELVSIESLLNSKDGPFPFIHSGGFSMRYLNGRIVSIFFSILFLTVPFTVAHGYTELPAGGISGTVTDASGAAVPHAAIKATEGATGTSNDTISSSAGDFNYTNLPIGPTAIPSLPLRRASTPRSTTRSR